jgi:hypothetical protein
MAITIMAILIAIGVGTIGIGVVGAFVRTVSRMAAFRGVAATHPAGSHMVAAVVAGAGIDKSEVRSSKAEGNPKSEFRGTAGRARLKRGDSACGFA